ncbi:MAG TPA: hypothetical protein VFG84_06490, partial [Gemmatimonadaceae bacterium]|nr:hypothetical protein [Gemmatimonadaceae bacterium]
DSVGLMDALARYMVETSGPDRIAVRDGFDPLLMPGARRTTHVPSLSAAAAAPLIATIRSHASGRIETVPLPRGPEALESARRHESTYPSVFAIAGFAFARDSAFILLTHTSNHDVRPSTFTSGEYRLQFAREAPGRWRLVSDSLIVMTDGYYDFAPLENLPAALQEAERLRRGGKRPPR